ncbi:MAG: Rieske (2Fe-2S) protein [Rhodospirillales bacterium]|nr:Rieske (2Fe-2S) protein [Rhodospirillales bacterium]
MSDLKTLCQLEEIPDGDSNGFAIETTDGKRISVLAVRQGKAVHAYVNACPHIGSPLDFTPGRFLNVEKTLIQCATHGALFRINDGHCVSGPCTGKGLLVVPAIVEGGTVKVRL